MGDCTYLSIDEQAVSAGSIDTESAHRNIHRLQQHFFNEKLCGVVMATAGIISAERQRSVTEEELFGDGGNNPGNDIATNADVSDTVIEQLRQVSDNIDATNIAELPNFSMLNSGSSSSSNSYNVLDSYSSYCQDEQTKSGEHRFSDADIERTKKMLSEVPDPESSDFKMLYQSKRSISDIHEKRKSFQNTKDADVFEETLTEQQEGQSKGRHVKKSNSVPGVSSSVLSPSSQQHYQSDPCSQSDKISEDNNLLVKFENKISIEGPSVKPTLKKRESQKLKLNRRVSFQDDVEKTAGAGNIFTDETKSDKPHRTPTEERRHTFRSSGYGTGSDGGSQETTGKDVEKRKNSQVSQGSSDVWTSQESVPGLNNGLSEEGYCSNASFEISCEEPKAEVCDSTDSSATQITVRRVFNNNDERVINEPDKLKSQGVKNRSGSLGSESLLVKQDPDDETVVGKPQTNCFMRLKSTDEKSTQNMSRTDSEFNEHRVRKSYDPSSFGNLPKLATLEDRSFQVKSSSMAKVIHEEDNNRHEVIAKHCISPNAVSSGSHLLPVTATSRKSPSPQNSPCDDVQRLVEMLAKDDFSPKQILDDFPHRSSSSSPSPTPNNSQILPHQDFSTIDLKRASLCNNEHCEEIMCQKLQEVMLTLGSDFPGSNQYELRKCYYQVLYDHNAECQEVKCPVRFCQEIFEWQSQSEDTFTVEDMGRAIQKHVTSPCMNIVLESNFTFFKLQRSEKKPDITNFETYAPLFPLGKFGTAIVCKENETDSLVVVTKYPVMDYKHQLSLYSRIVDLTHPNIVRQLWLLEYEEKIQVCTVFAKGGNLKDYLTSIRQLPWQLAVVYMRQLLSAISHLHSDKYGVIYLYWSSENFVFTDHGRRVIQLGNFHLACPQGNKLDYGSLKACLPYGVCPPELIKDNVVDFKSDCWGAGCMLFEMMSGSGYLHELRHEDESVVHERVKLGIIPDLSGFKPELRTILESCWQIDKERRLSVDEILMRLNSISLKVS